MHLESLGCDHDDRKFWTQSALATFDIEKFFRSQVCTKAGLRDHIVTVGHGHFGCQHRVTSVCDIGKRATVDKCRCIFGGLHQVGMDGIFHQYGDGTCHTQVFHRKRLSIPFIAQQNVLDSAAQVIFIFRQAKDGHQLRCCRDIESGLLWHAISRSKSGDNVTQAPVVHIQYPLPEDLLNIIGRTLYPKDIIVEQC